MRVRTLLAAGFVSAVTAGMVPWQHVSAAEEAKPAVPSGTTAAGVGAKTHSKAEIEAMLTECSDEADAKGLNVSRGKGAERKAFRRACMHRMGVDPR